MSAHTVLFVDDEANILKAIRRVVRGNSMQVLTATDAAEALTVLDTHPTHVVVSDQRMPHMNGVELLAEVRQRHPEVVCLMLTGYTQSDVALEAVDSGDIFRLIAKPWNDEELKLSLRQALDHYDRIAEARRVDALTGPRKLEG